MADDEFNVLAMYTEEDEEDSGAAMAKEEKQKQKQMRRQNFQIQEQPPPPLSPKAMARRELREKLREYDPKSGCSFYTRLWFLDLTKFDLDAETQYGPMRFTNSLIKGNHKLTDSLNVLCLKIMSSDVGFPINLYGTVIIRDDLDMKCNYIFRRDRNNCQLVKSPGDSLILTGPSRGVVFRSDAYFEIDLKIREGKERDDRKFNKAFIDVDRERINSMVQRETVATWLSEVELVFSYVKKALEGTVEIKILSGPDSFVGKITACTTDLPDEEMLLCDSSVDDAVTLGADRVIQLLRSVVAVSADELLVLKIWDGSACMAPRIIRFTPLIKDADRDVVYCGLHELRVGVVWSTLCL